MGQGFSPVPTPPTPNPGMKLVITGVGAVTALGRDCRATWPRLMAGANGIAPIKRFDASSYPSSVAAEVRDEDLVWDDTSVPREYCRRGTRLLVQSALEAAADAGLHDAPYLPHEVGVASGVSVNYLHMEHLRRSWQARADDGRHLDVRRLAERGGVPEWALHRQLGDFASAAVAGAVGVSGPQFVVDSACAASAHAIGEAARWIRRGRVRAMIAGGGCGIVVPVGVLAFGRLGALSANRDPETASRPFDRDRDGFVLGEGGGAVVLETLDEARRRGARIYAELAGFASTLSAHSLTDPSPDGAAEAEAMRVALADGSIRLDSIGYIAAHGTSTPKNDTIETMAVKRVFGSHADRLMMSSVKGQLGHTLSAAGALNVIAAAMAISKGEVPPTAHYANPDPDCDLDYVPNTGRTAPVRAALAAAFAFGGQNAVIALRAVG